MRLDALFASCALFACWRSSSPPPAPAPVANQAAPAPRRSPPPLSENELILQRFDQFAVDMCNCSDSSCAQTVAEEMTRWSQEQAGKRAEAPKMDDEETKRAVEIAERMGTCMQKAMIPPPAGSATP